MKTAKDGTTSSEIFRMPECPIKLGAARSMTSARIDFEGAEDRLISWYESTNQGEKDEWSVATMLNQGKPS